MRFWKLMYRLVFGAKLYFTWSHIYRLIHHREYMLSIPIGKMSPEHLDRQMKKLTWTRDSFRELWDAIGSPHWVQYCINIITTINRQPPGALDCDEFSVWAASVLLDKYRPVVLNIVWKKPKVDKTPKGHHVCMYVDDRGYFHTGNFGTHGPFTSRSSTIVDVLHKVKRNTQDLVGWATFTPDLTLIDYSTKGLPDN